MKYIARGYTHHDPCIAPDPVTITVVGSVAEYDALQEARRDLWWTLQPQPSRWEQFLTRIPSEPTPQSRMVGALLAVSALIVVLGIVGWIEGL